MTITVGWLNPEHTLIQQVLAGSYTYDDVLVLMEKTAQMLDSVSHPVVVVSDLSESRARLPLSTFALRRIAGARLHQHENLSALYLVGLDTYVALAFNTVKRMFPTMFSKYIVASKEAVSARFGLKQAESV